MSQPLESSIQDWSALGSSVQLPVKKAACVLLMPSPQNTVGNLKSVSGDPEPQILHSTERCAPLLWAELLG